MKDNISYLRKKHKVMKEQDLPIIIFNSILQLEANIEIYTTDTGTVYLYGGETTFKGERAILIKFPGRGKDKRISEIEVEKLWIYLIKNRKLNIHDVLDLCPSLYNNRGCCKYAIMSIFEILFPKSLEFIRGIKGNTKNVTEVRFKK